MLDAFKKMGTGGGKPAQEQADELEALINTSREERGALSAMLTQIEVHAKKLSHVGKSLHQVNDRATGATGKLEELSTKLSALEARTKGFEQVEGRVRSLGDAVGQAEQTADKLLAPDGELQKHRQAVQQLATQTIQTTANLDALKKERTGLDQLRDGLRQAQGEVKDSAERTVALKGDFDKLRARAAQLQQEHGRMKDSLRSTREEATNTTEAVRGVEKKLGPLAELNELSKTTEERLATLNSLAEHVLQKVKVLENQKHTVEHAVVESSRLSEMVWNMDVQVGKLNEGTKLAAEADETLRRIEQVSSEITTQLEQAQQTKTGFSADLTKLDKGRGELTEFVKAHFERLSLERKEFESFDQRVQALQNTLGALERGFDGLAGKEKAVVVQVTKQLKQLDQRHTQLSFAEKRIAGFEGRLTELKTLSDNVESQIQAIATREAFVGSVKKGVDEVHQISQRSRADLQHVVDHRNQVDALRAQLDAALKSVGETEERMAVIETRKKLVDEVQLKTNVIVNVLEDVRVNLEMLSEQRAVVDHVVESMARVNDTVHSAQATLKALQTERELAERIERGIKLLRSKTGVPVDQGRQESA